MAFLSQFALEGPIEALDTSFSQPSSTQVPTQKPDSVAGDTGNFLEHQAKPRVHVKESSDARPWQPAHPQHPAHGGHTAEGPWEHFPGSTHFCFHCHLPRSAPLLGINQSSFTHCHHLRTCWQDPALSKPHFLHTQWDNWTAKKEHRAALRTPH